jgi:hypothetical protein
VDQNKPHSALCFQERRKQQSLKRPNQKNSLVRLKILFKVSKNQQRSSQLVKSAISIKSRLNLQLESLQSHQKRKKVTFLQCVRQKLIRGLSAILTSKKNMPNSKIKILRTKKRKKSPQFLRQLPPKLFNKQKLLNLGQLRQSKRKRTLRLPNFVKLSKNR